VLRIVDNKEGTMSHLRNALAVASVVVFGLVGCGANVDGQESIEKQVSALCQSNQLITSSTPVSATGSDNGSPATNATDFNSSTAWWANGTPSTLTVDLGSNVTADALELDWVGTQNPYIQFGASQFKIQGATSANPNNFVDILTNLSNPLGTFQTTTHHELGGGSYRYYRVVYQQHIPAGFFGEYDFTCVQIRVYDC
jgi:hypothetical protein